MEQQDELRLLLEEIDQMGTEVTEWEANFINSVLSQEYPWTPKQRETVEKIVKKYLPF